MDPLFDPSRAVAVDEPEFDPDRAIAVPDSTKAVLMEERGQVVSFPEEYSPAEMDYSVKVDVDQKDKNNFFGMLEYSGELVSNVGKGLANFFISTPQVAGSLLKEFGENIEYTPEDLKNFAIIDSPQELLAATGKGLAYEFKLPERFVKVGQKFIDMNKEFITEVGIEPTESTGPQKVAFDIGSGIGSVGASIGLTFLTKKPTLVAPVFGAIQKAQIYEESRAAGKTPQEAGAISTTAGIVETVLEGAGLHVFFDVIKTDKMVAKVALRVLEEGVQEGSQQAGEEVNLLLSKVRKDSATDIVKRIGYAAAIGIVSSSPSAVTITMIERQGVIKDLKEFGFTDQEAKVIIEGSLEEVMQKGLPDAVSDVLEREMSGLVATPEERQKMMDEVKAALPIAQVDDNQANDEIGDFVPAEPSTRPTFEQQAQKILGEQVTRADVMSRLQDEKQKMKLAELDETAQQLNETLTYLEKRARTLSKSGKDPIGLANVEKLIQMNQKQYDVVDSERADILTSVKNDFEKQKLVVTGKQVTDIALQQQIRGFKQGVKEGRKITQKEVADTRKMIQEVIAQSELRTGEAESLLTKEFVAKIDTPQKLANAIEKIDKRISEIVKTRQSKELKLKIQDILAGTATRSLGGKAIGKYTPEIQEVLDRAREISKMTRAEARDKITANLASLKDDELVSEEMKLENRLLDMMAGFSSRNPQQLTEILKELEAIVTTGRASSLLKGLAKREQQQETKKKGLAVLTGGKPLDLTKRQTWQDNLKKKMAMAGKSLWSPWETLLDQLSLRDKTSKQEQSFISKAFSVSGLQTKRNISISWLSNQLIEIGRRIYGFSNDYQFAKKMIADSSEMKYPVFKHADGTTKIINDGEGISLSQIRKRVMEFRMSEIAQSLMAIDGDAYTPEMIKWLEDQLTDADRAFIDAQLQFYREYRDRVNPYYREETGVNMANIENYSPIRRALDKDIVGSPLIQEEQAYASFIPSSFKERKKNHHPIKNIGDWEALQRHIAQNEHFIHWADMIRNMNAFFSDGEVRKVISHQFGESVLGTIDQFVQDFKSQGIRQKASYDKWIDALRMNKIVFELGGKPAQLVKQVTGMFAFAEFVSPAEFVSGTLDFWKDPIGNYKTLAKSDLFILRQGDITQQFMGILSSKEAQKLQKNPSLQMALRIWMTPIRLGDAYGVVLGGWPIYKSVLAKTGSEEQALKAFEEAVYKVQPTNFIGSLSKFQRGGSFQRLFTMFTSSQHKYFLRELTVIRNAIAGRATPAEVAKVVAIHHIIIPTLFQIIANGFKWDDEDQLRAMLTGPLNGAFILGDFIDGFVRNALNTFADTELGVFRKDNPIYESGDGFYQAMNSIDIESIALEDVLEALKTVSVKSIGPLTGLPTKSILEVYPQAFDDINEGEVMKGTLKLGGWSPYQLNSIYDKERTFFGEPIE